MVAGKSGGHIVPGITYVARLLANKKNIDFTIFTTTSSLDHKILKNYEGVYSRHVCLTFGALPYGCWYKLPLTVWQLLRSFLHAFYVLHKTKPELVVSMAGAVSLPVCMAAWLLRIPIDLFELNAVPGRASSLLKRFAKRVNVCFESAAKFFGKKAFVCPYPVRFGSDTLDYDQESVRATLGLSANKKTVVLLGGSQGSKMLSSMLVEWARTLSGKHRQQVQIIHQVGNVDPELIKQEYESLGIQALVFAQRHDLAPCYQAADLIVCRAGAGTLFEVEFFGKPCVTVPLRASTTSHQVDNALAMHEKNIHLFSVCDEQSLCAAIGKQSLFT